jgi:transcriptional regulator with PAS, ATPase and Fis domain
VAINCGAIPEGLLESELFGHRRGAFTGAVRDHEGAIASASGGTVFLDEVGELPPMLQVKLLRFLQEGEIRPVGSDRDVAVAVRVVAATHRDLQSTVQAGEVREDFFYRIAAYQIEIPPLRERVSDIPLLVEHFRRAAVQRSGGRDIPGLSAAATELLEQHPWPGNVRELENLVQRAAIDLGGLNNAEGLARILGRRRLEGAEPRHPAAGDDLTLEELERVHIELVLRRCAGNRTRAAKILGIERKSLYRKAERLGISLDER